MARGERSEAPMEDRYVIQKLQLTKPIASPTDVYTSLEVRRHRATMTVQPHGVDVQIAAAANRPGSGNHHFFVPWSNIDCVFYADPARPKPVSPEHVGQSEMEGVNA
jgi:hypothetical protein